ncbi:MAG: outer membrane beta-barrel protein [Burkholderiales bacterium]|nr:outer membrane beta-barrel protein [Burkholderiales bacterium]
MTSRTAVRRAAVVAGVLSVVAPGRAPALEGDRIRPSVGLNYTYVSNLFYLDDRIPDSQLPFLKNGQRSDNILGLRAGLDADIPVSRQMFTIRANATDNMYATYDNLDYVSYNLRGTWNWVVGSDWDGDVGIAHYQALGSFADVNFNVRNIRNTDEYFASGMYRIASDWKLRAAVRNTQLRNSAASFATTDRNDNVYEFGSRRYSKGGDNFLGVNFRMIDGRFPNRQVVAGSTVDNSYRQYTLEGTVDWRYSGQSKLSGALGWTNRLHDQISQRNFSGITGRLTAVYSPSGIVGLNAAVFREIGDYQDITASYILTQGVRIGPSYAVSEKLALQANYQYSVREFLGDPNFLVNPQPTRKDDINSLSGTVIWSPLRNAQISATLSYDMRTSNRVNLDYDVTTFFVGGQITF